MKDFPLNSGKIREYRLLCGLKQEELGKEIGLYLKITPVSLTTISRWENEKIKNCRKSYAEATAQIFSKALKKKGKDIPWKKIIEDIKRGGERTVYEFKETILDLFGNQCMYEGCNRENLVALFTDANRVDDSRNYVVVCPKHLPIVRRNMARKERLFLSTLRRAHLRSIASRAAIKSIRDSSDPLLSYAYKLYTQRIEADERDETSDFGRWIEEMEDLRLSYDSLIKKMEGISLTEIREEINDLITEGKSAEIHEHLLEIATALKSKEEIELFIREEIQKLEEYFFVHHIGNYVLGFVYFQYYFKNQYGFVSFLVCDREAMCFDTRKILTEQGIYYTILEKYSECRGVLFEIDQEDEARSRLFKRYPHVRRILDIQYFQPKSPMDGSRIEMPLELFFLPLPLDLE